MRRARNTLPMLACAALFMVCPVFAVSAAHMAASDGGTSAGASPEGLSVLVISSFHQDLPFAKKVEAGLNQALRYGEGRNAVYYEYLDSARFNPDDYGALYAKLMAQKYQTRKIDAVVVWASAAARFVDRYWDDIKPRRVIAAELPPALLAPLRDRGAEVRTVLSAEDYEPALRTTVEVGAAKKVLLLGEALGDNGRQRLSGLLAGWRYSPQEAELENLFDRPLNEAVARVAAAKPGEVVHYTPIFHDEKGRNIRPLDALIRIAAASPVPVFSQWDTFVAPAAAAGGWVLSGELMGRSVGLLTAALATGNADAATAVERLSPYRMLFDAGRLEHWAVPESRLPAGAEVLNRRPSVWEEHRAFVLSAAAALTLTSLLSVFSLRLSTARRRLLTELALERENLAAKVAERTADLDAKAVELARSNSELESFAYAVSHDLRTPLRAVSAYAKLLSASLGEKLDAEEKENFSFIAVGAARMDGMIQGLLEYSRAGRAAEHGETCRLCDAVAEALAACDLPHAAPGAAVIVDAPDDLPSVRAAQAGAERLAMNLIDNALKYRSPDRPLQLSITARAENGAVILTVADNGVGIPQDQQERVFGLFQRLTRHGDGYGVGLALCRRIMDACGGRLWVESTPGQGSAFHAVFPVA